MKDIEGASRGTTRPFVETFMTVQLIKHFALIPDGHLAYLGAINADDIVQVIFMKYEHGK